MSEKMYKVREVANLFAVQPDTVRDWLKDGTIKGIKIGKGYYWRIPHSEVERLAMMRHGETNAQG